jgi:hypothetical protein
MVQVSTQLRESMTPCHHAVWCCHDPGWSSQYTLSLVADATGDPTNEERTHEDEGYARTAAPTTGRGKRRGKDARDGARTTPITMHTEGGRRERIGHTRRCERRGGGEKPKEGGVRLSNYTIAAEEKGRSTAKRIIFAGAPPAVGATRAAWRAHDVHWATE